MERLDCLTNMKRYVLTTVVFAILGVGGMRQALCSPSPTAAPSEGRSSRSVLAHVAAADESLDNPSGLEPRTSRLMTREQWKSFLSSPEHERKFQEFKHSEEFDLSQKELESIASEGSKRGGLAADEIGRIRFYLHHRDYGTRCVALELATKLAISDQAKASLSPDVIARLQDVSPTVRRAAIPAVVTLKGSDAVPFLSERLGDPEPTVREPAGDAIGKLLDRKPQSSP